MMALLQNDGDLPESYSESNQSSAMEEIRAESGRGADQFLFTDDIQSILSDHGVEGTFTINDPLQTSGKLYQATEEQLTNIITQPAEGNTPWVYTV